MNARHCISYVIPDPGVTPPLAVYDATSARSIETVRALPFSSRSRRIARTVWLAVIEWLTIRKCCIDPFTLVSDSHKNWPPVMKSETTISTCTLGNGGSVHSKCISVEFTKDQG